MALFLVEHSHPAERCPATRPQEAALLLAHISAATAARYGVAIQAEAVLVNHTLSLIVEADDQEHVERYAAYFARLGSVQIRPAATVEAVVERQSCAHAVEGRV